MSGGASPGIRLMICDDHPVVRTGLRGMLSGEPDFEVAGEAANAGRPSPSPGGSSPMWCSWT